MLLGKLSWIVSSKVSGQQLSVATYGILTEDDKIDIAIERFWKLGETESTQQLSPYYAQREAHVNQNITREKDGRLVLQLPFCAETSAQGDSNIIALNFSPWNADYRKIHH